MDVPTYNRSRLMGSSRTTCRKSPGPPVGRLFTIDENDLPPSFDTNRCGRKSPHRWLSNATYTTLVSNFDASIRVTYTSPPFGSP